MTFRSVSGVFVTGTDTNVGKTVVASALLRAVATQMATTDRVIGIKAIQTGVSGSQSVRGDVLSYQRAVSDLRDNVLRPVAVRQYALAASPHLSARKEGTSLDALEVAADVRSAGQGADFLVIEGAGGIDVPLNDQETMADLMRELGFPVLLVGTNSLGAISRVLVAVNALHTRGIKVAGVVLSNLARAEGPDEVLIRRDNLETLHRRLDTPLVELPFMPNAATLDGVDFEPLAGPLRALAEDLLSAGPDEVAEASILEYDRAHLWHPYTSATTPLPVTEISYAKGVHLYLPDGTRLIDGMSSWWCAIHGYSHPALVRALQAQSARMSHVMFGGLTHEPAVSLARRLVAMTPTGLRRVFFSDSGSVSVEVAMKMAIQYRMSRGETGRTRFLTVRGGYHGDTLGAMSVCDPVTGMHGLFADTLVQQIFVERPGCRFDQAFDLSTLDSLKNNLEAEGDTITAVILEPIVQGAGGMWFYHPDYLKHLRVLCDEHGILLIFDEIATGFGRTGKLFASDWAGVSPDIMCVGKSLTGGMMTLAATLCTDTIAETISQNGGCFMHGPTFMGNPLACAVANASIDLLLDSPWQTRIDLIQNVLRETLEPLNHLPSVADVRVLGAIGVVETVDPVNMERLQAFFVERGVWIRPFGKLIYLMPPYVIDEESLRRLATTVVDVVQLEARNPGTFTHLSNQ